MNYQSFAKQLPLKTTAALFFLGLLFCSAFTVLRSPADFSGEWTLNEGKSDLGQFAAFAPRKLSISESSTGAMVQRTSVGQDGQERTSKDSLSYDGKETESTVFGNSKKKSTVKWSDDGQTMTVNSTINLERDGQTMEIKLTENWKLADGGKSLNLESTSSSSFGENTMKLVFDKVK